MIKLRVATGYLLAALLLTLSTWQAPADHLIGTSSDPVSIAWSIRWSAFAVGHGINPVYSTYLNAPLGVNMLWNIPTSLPLLVLWPVTAVLGSAVTYNIAMTAGVAMSAFVAFILIRRHVASLTAAVLGGAVYGFSPYMLGQLLGHANLVLSAISVPIVVLLIEEVTTRRRLHPITTGALIAALAVVQFFVWPEALVTDVMFGSVVLAVLAILQRDRVREALPHAARSIAWAALLSVVLLAAPIVYQLAGPAHVSGPVHPAGIYVTDLLNLVVPTPVQQFAPPAAAAVTQHFTGNVEEWAGYVGIPLLAVLAVLLVRARRDVLVRAAGVVAVVFIVLSLGDHLHVAGHTTWLPLPWWIADRIPVLQDVLPARLMVYAWLAIAGLAAVAIDRLARSRRPRYEVALVTAAALLPLVPMLPGVTQRVSAPAYFTSAGGAQQLPQGSTALVLPWPDQYDVSAMTWQSLSGMRFRLVGGYFNGPAADGSGALRDHIAALLASPDTVPSADDRAALTGELQQLQVDEVIAGPGSGDAVILFTRLLGPPAYADDQVTVWGVAR